MQEIIVDWSTIRSKEQLMDLLCHQAEEPFWHGRNLDALHDSWVTGGINPTGPPYQFNFLNCTKVSPHLNELASKVMEIAEFSVNGHGGSCSKT